MYRKVDLSFVARDRNEGIKEALFAVRRQKSIPPAVEQAKSLLERAFARINQDPAVQLEAIYWHYAVHTVQDHLLGAVPCVR